MAKERQGLMEQQMLVSSYVNEIAQLRHDLRLVKR